MLLALTSTILSFVEAEDTLKFSIVFIRHGARSSRNPKLKIKDVEWTEGKDALTASGTRQLYLLGRMMHDYYITQRKLLPPIYNGTFIHARASDSARTLMSCQSFLLGLYPNNAISLSETQVKNEKYWKPPNTLELDDEYIKGLGKDSILHGIPIVPIISYNKNFERTLSFGFCDKFYKFRMDYYDTERFEKVYEKYKKSFQEACKRLGLDCVNLKGRVVWEYVDAMVTAEFDGQLQEIHDLSEDLDKFYTEAEEGELSHNKEFQTSIAMNQFSEIIPEYLFNATNGSTPLKMLVLSAHESTLLSYLIAMNISLETYQTVPYASSFIIELLKNESGHFVNVTLNSKILFIRSLTNFTTWLKELGQLNDTWENLCKLPNSSLLQSQTSSMLVPVIIAVFGVIIILEILLCARKKRRELNENSLVATV